MLFSEPKIPQYGDAGVVADGVTYVSVLFSEPKIPQFKLSAVDAASGVCFSALQRAENSSIYSRNRRGATGRVSVLFSEPKIPQFELATVGLVQRDIRFSALQRAENSSIVSRPA